MIYVLLVLDEGILSIGPARSMKKERQKRLEKR